MAPTLASLVALIFVAVAFGASGPSIATLNADVWPEHDDPRVLVIYRGTLGSGVVLPATLTFVTPSTAQVNAAAYRGTDGQLLTTPHEYRQDGTRLLVSMTIPAREFQFEYYVDAVTGATPQRAFAVDLIFTLPVDNLRVTVEQPLRSTAFTLDPPAQSSVVAGGFTHHQYFPGPWPSGRVWRVGGRYRKEGRDPSVSRAAPAGAPTPVQTEAPGPSQGIPRWWWAVAVALIAAVVAGVFLAGTRRQRRHPAGATRGGPQPRPSTGTGTHCPNCGARMKRKDRYCSKCGKPLESNS